MSKSLNILIKNIQLYASGKNIVAISKESGVPQSTLSRLMNSQSNPSLDTIDKIAEALNVSTSDLFITKGDRNIPSDILEMLEGQSDTVYETIRTMLKALESQRSSKAN